MDSATLGGTPPVNDARAAQRLAEALDNGGWLNPIEVGDAPLQDDEVAYADTSAFGWRFHVIDVPYEHRTVMFGGPLLFIATAIGSWALNRRRRREAQRQAMPQWRPLGQIRVVVTSSRLLVLHNGGWYPSGTPPSTRSARCRNLEPWTSRSSPTRLTGSLAPVSAPWRHTSRE